MVTGAVVDFNDDGLAGAGFAIDNPNVSGGCGCGKSFS
jgi:iron-sulfur cluster assembly protein